MIFLGVDPDLHTTALAFADEAKVYAVKVVRVDAKLKGVDAVVAMCRAIELEAFAFVHGDCKQIHDVLAPPTGLVVEGQRYHHGRGGPKANPEDLINLATVSGSALAGGPDGITYRPLPHEWKGTISKDAHQGHVCRALGWEFERRGTGRGAYCVPTKGHEAVLGIEALKVSDWKHCLDAIGLARWGALKLAAKKAKVS